MKTSRIHNVLITGASSGIGEALALQYAKSTAQNLFICGRNEKRLKDVARRCKTLGAKVHPAILDVTNRAEMENWIKDCHQISPLNLVIANAGTSSVGETPDSIYNTFNTNLYGVLNTILPTIELYRQTPLTSASNKPTIVLISSIAGYHGLSTCPSYSASKAAVKAYGEALRVKLKPEGINVNVVCPGFVRSRITDQNTCPMPFFMEASAAAKIIAEGISVNKAIISFPFPLRFSSWLISILPNCISDWIYAKLPKKA